MSACGYVSQGLIPVSTSMFRQRTCPCYSFPSWKMLPYYHICTYTFSLRMVLIVCALNAFAAAFVWLGRSVAPLFHSNTEYRIPLHNCFAWRYYKAYCYFIYAAHEYCLLSSFAIKDFMWHSQLLRKNRGHFEIQDGCNPLLLTWQFYFCFTSDMD